jgi:hypothetical protein
MIVLLIQRKIHINRQSFHVLSNLICQIVLKMQLSCSSSNLITHVMDFNFILFTMPKVREEWTKLLVLLVFFYQQSPCTWSLPCLYEQDTLWTKHGWVCQLSQILQSEGPGSIRTCTLSKMLSASTINASFQTATGRTKNMGNTISRGAVIKVSTSRTRWLT